MSRARILGIGVIGCGGAGQGLAENVARMPRTRLIGVCDVDRKAGESAAEQFKVPFYPEAVALLGSGGLDAVIVASPQFAHHEHAMMAITRGKHVFCEKPMALKLEDCDAMIAAADKAGVKLCVGQVLRLIPVYARACQLASSGEIGSPLGISVTRSGYDSPLPREHWRSQQRLSGGLLFEIYVHELDLMRHVCGEPKTIYAQAQTLRQDSTADFPDLWLVIVRFRSGAVGVLRASASSHILEHFFTIQGTAGTISNNVKDVPLLMKKTDGTATGISKEELERMEDGYYWELRSWVEAIQNDAPLIVTAWDGRQAVAMAEAAIESARLGRPVELAVPTMGSS